MDCYGFMCLQAIIPVSAQIIWNFPSMEIIIKVEKERSLIHFHRLNCSLTRLIFVLELCSLGLFWSFTSLFFTLSFIFFRSQLDEEITYMKLKLKMMRDFLSACQQSSVKMYGLKEVK